MEEESIPQNIDRDNEKEKNQERADYQVKVNDKSNDEDKVQDNLFNKKKIVKNGASKMQVELSIMISNYLK